MPISDYMRTLRERVGSGVIEIPTVSIILFDEQDRILLLRDVESGDWTTPGGMIEPYETPSDAAVREMWEETGLFVRLLRVIGVFGGEACSSRYSNGDLTAWVSSVFEAVRVSGDLKPDGTEAHEARFTSREDLRGLPCKSHVQVFLEAAWSREPQAIFQPSSWRPPDS